MAANEASPTQTSAISVTATTFQIVGQDVLILSVSHEERAERAFAMLVTGNFFDVVGAPPMVGRTFLPEEDRTPNGAPVLVLSHAYWPRRFGGDRTIVGRTIIVNGHPYTIIGVMRPAFIGTALGLAADAWVPMMQQPQLHPSGSRLEARGSSWMQAIVRLRPGVSEDQSKAELESIRAHLVTRSSEATNKVSSEADERNHENRVGSWELAVGSWGLGVGVRS